MFQPQATPLDLLRSSYGNDNNYDFDDTAYTVSAGGPVVFDAPAFSPIGTGFTPINSANNPPQQQPFYAKMDNVDNNPYHEGGGSGDKSFQEQMSTAEQESMKYEPEITGPLVGEKKSCHAITEEYARGDPIYVAKTAALPQTYSHYRPIRGDGNCGWRAVACGYFETLLQGDSARVHSELARLESLNTSLLQRASFDAWVYEDMVEFTFELLKKVAAAIDAGIRDNSIIIDSLNDADISNAIVYHFRLLASATLRVYPTEYEPFIPDGLTVDGYCKTWLEPSFNEIDHLGMSLLVDVLFKPISFAVEIVYLDRSEGAQVNTHRFGAVHSPDVPTIYLLYRPGHYDILYKNSGNPARIKQILDDASRHSDIQVHRASSFVHQHESTASNPMAMGGFGGLDMSVLSHIPGFSMPSMNSHHGFPSMYTPISSNPLPSPSFPAASPTTSHPITYTNPNPNPTTTTLPLHPAPSMSDPNVGSGLGIGVGSGNTSSNARTEAKFRMSAYEYEAQWADSTPTFQTSTFKNSHYNTAHYNNPNFHPEQWSPDFEDGGGSGRMGSSGRHHSS